MSAPCQRRPWSRCFGRSSTRRIRSATSPGREHDLWKPVIADVSLQEMDERTNPADAESIASVLAALCLESPANGMAVQQIRSRATERSDELANPGLARQVRTAVGSWPVVPVGNESIHGSRRQRL